MRQLLAHPTNFTAGRQRPVDRIVVHYTAGDGDTAENNGRYFQGADRKASAHYFVDERETVRSVREEDTAWHAGSWEMNCRSVGVEMCSRKDGAGKYYIPQATVENTAKLVRELMQRYAVSPENVLRHYDVTGKNCPAPMVENETLWRSFKTGLEGSDAPAPWAADACEWAKTEGFIRGDENGIFRWQDAVTRQELAVILQRLCRK